MNILRNLFGSKEYKLQQRIASLIAALGSYSDQERREAAKKLVELGAIAVEPLIESMRSCLPFPDEIQKQKLAAAMDVLREIGIPAVQPLIAELNTNNGFYAAKVLGNIGANAKEAVPALIEVLDDLTIGGVAAEALGKMGAPAIEPLFAILEDEKASKRSRIRSTWALENMGKRQVADRLAAALNTNDFDVRLAVAVLLGKMGDGRGVSQLIAALKNDDESTCIVAIEGLGKINDAEARKALLSAIEDPRPHVKLAAEGASTSPEKLIEELVLIGRKEGYIAAPGGKYDEHHNHKRARHIGEILNMKGGMELMRDAHAKVARQLTRPGAARELESCWSGVGKWRG